MKISFFPKSKLGAWSVVLFVIMVICIAYFFVMTGIFDQRGGDTFFSNLNLTIPMLLAWACGLACLITGVLSLIISKPRSILVFLFVAITLLTTLYGILEVSSPH